MKATAEHFGGLLYGVRNGELLHISEVPRGRACKCVCPACDGNLLAKQGKVREWHFAHESGDTCTYAVETALHLAAKEILSERKEIVLPAVEIWFHNRTESIAAESSYQLDSVELERRIGEIVPDVLAYVGSRPILIEVKVTHGIDDQKLKRIRDLNISAVEIDLSTAPREFSSEDLEGLVIDGGGHKRWVHNVVAKRRRQRVLSEATTLRGIAGYVYGCPIPARVLGGKPYAHVVSDCIRCKHALQPIGNGVICEGFGRDSS